MGLVFGWCFADVPVCQCINYTHPDLSIAVNTIDSTRLRFYEVPIFSLSYDG